MQRNAILPLIQGLKICDFLESQIVKMMYTVVLIGRLFEGIRAIRNTEL